MTISVQDPNDYIPDPTGQGYKLKDFGEAKTLTGGSEQNANRAAGYGMESQADANQNTQLFDQYFGLTNPQQQQSLVNAFQTNQVSTPQQQKALTNEQAYANSIEQPQTWYDKLAGELALGTTVGVATAGIGSGVGALVGGGFGGAVAGGTAAGAAGAGLTDVLTGQPLTLGSIGKGAGMGALGGAASSLAPVVSDATGLSPATSANLVKAGVGAIGSEINGGNPLSGAVSAGLSSAIGGPVGGLAGNLAGGAINSALTPQGSNNGAQAPNGTQNNMIGGGSINPFTYNPSSGTGGAGVGNSILGGLGGLFGAGMGIASNNQQSNLQQNAYTTAGNAGNYNPFNYSGLGGMGVQYQNGTGSLSAGGFNPSQFQGLTSSALGSAGQYASGSLPQGVTQAGNTAMNAYGQAQNTANTGVNQGQNMYNQGNALVNGANSTYNSAYQNSLTAAQQALQQPLQQQYNTLRNQQFETGMSGTSGGALQTQAFATGMGQAELQAQQNAVGQANTAQSNALGYGTNMMNTGLNNTGQFNTQGANLAGQGLNTQMGLGTYSPQLSGMYANLANTGVSGLSGVNSMDTQLASLGLQGMMVGGNNMNNAARTQGGIAQSNNYTNQNSGYSTALNSLFGNGGSGGIIGSLFGGGTSSGGNSSGGILGALSSLFGGSSGSNNPTNYGLNQTGQLSNNFDLSGGTQNLINQSAPTFDFSNIGAPPSNYTDYSGLNSDNMGAYGF